MKVPVIVALHTDHCQADKLDKYVIPLVEETERRRAAGKPNLFNSHMFDGSALILKEPRYRGKNARTVPEERSDLTRAPIWHLPKWPWRSGSNRL